MHTLCGLRGTSAVMNKQNNVTQLPTRLDAAERRAIERAQTAARSFLHARRQLDEQLARIGRAIEDSAVDRMNDEDATAVLREFAEAQASFLRLIASVAIGHEVVDGAKLSASIAEIPDRGVRPPTEPGRSASSRFAVIDERLSSVAELAELGADSIVIQAQVESADRPRPYQRGDDGNWYGYGAAGGITSQALWRRGDELIVALRSDRPVTAGASQRDRVASEAAYRGWSGRESRRRKLTFQRDGVAIDVWFASAKNTVTKALRTAPDGTPNPAGPVGQFGTVLRWLAEE
ncbi:hypothetical protein [Nocardia blacklockiae]|uniref:hypothetical protein n=1 Tax=Nocardia blacklockiae TaxID=480036 RepID=UPI001895D67E|nr:hypothetical protein [Nocardia blacklockiae]MBF6173590.1 hypothetical protein [Nocardia blacklockiae]